MKLSFVARFILTASAFAPASAIYAIVWCVHGSYIGVVICLSIGGLLVLTCFLMTNYAIKKLQPMPYTAKAIESADAETISFLLIYLLPLMTNEFSTTNWEAWLLVALILCLAVSCSYGYQFNPVLAMFRWHCFKVTDDQGRTSVLITKNKLYEPEERLSVGKITEYLLIDKEPNPH